MENSFSEDPILDVSLIIPCYQEAPHLKESVLRIFKVFALTPWKFELIFVDDCSTDRTREIILEICEGDSRCKYFLHERNLGRGAAVKTGYAQAHGIVAGFIDIDLEVDAHFMVPLIQQILDGQADIATGDRRYILAQTKNWTRHYLSVAYKKFSRFMLGTNHQDSETGIKFFNTKKCHSLVLSCRADGWFWDTEVMSTAFFKGYRILEQPVLFLRRRDKKSTVRIFRDVPNYLNELFAFRSRLGLGYFNKSPICWSVRRYDYIMDLFRGTNRSLKLQAVASLVEPGDRVLELSCGTARIYFDFLSQKNIDYIGMDFNGRVVNFLRNRGIRCLLADILEEINLPIADYVILCSGLHQFRGRENELVAKMKAAAKKQVVISELIRRPREGQIQAGIFRDGLSYLIGARAPKRGHSLSTFQEVSMKNGASDIIYKEGESYAIAVFKGNHRTE